MKCICEFSASLHYSLQCHMIIQ